MPLRRAPRLAALSLVALSAVLTGCAASTDEWIGSSGDAVSTANERAAFYFFTAKGLTDVQAAGIVGNLDQESGMDPTIKQYGGGPGRGIAQWSAGGRWDTDAGDNVVGYAGQHGQSATSLDLQLEFVWYELETFHGYGLASLRAATSIGAAVVAFQNDFEGCGACDQSQRVAYAQKAYNAYHGGSGSSSGSSSGGGSSSSSSSSGGSSSSGSSSGGGSGDCSLGGHSYVTNTCTETLQCDQGAWVARSSDPSACDRGVEPSGGCITDTGSVVPMNTCTSTLQCDDGAWVDRFTDPSACL